MEKIVALLEELESDGEITSKAKRVLEDALGIAGSISVVPVTAVYERFPSNGIFENSHVVLKDTESGQQIAKTGLRSASSLRTFFQSNSTEQKRIKSFDIAMCGSDDNSSAISKQIQEESKRWLTQYIYAALEYSGGCIAGKIKGVPYRIEKKDGYYFECGETYGTYSKKEECIAILWKFLTI